MGKNRALKLLITGGSGFIGQKLVPLARQQFEVAYTYFAQDRLGLPNGFGLDLRDAQATQRLIADWQPDAVIHTAGSNGSEDMEQVICAGTRHLLAALPSSNTRFIFLSTDVLFDGQHAPYNESDPPNPIHAYGRAKAQTEALVAQHPNHLIARTSLVYDLQQPGPNFAWLLQKLQAKEPVTLFSNQWRCPIWIETLNRALLELVVLDYVGILHLAGRQAINRAELGLKLLDIWAVQDRQSLMIAEDDGRRWPLDCRLDSSLGQQLLQTPLLGIDELLYQIIPSP